MSKHQRTKPQPNSRANTSMVGPENSTEGFIPSYEDIQRRAYEIHEQKGGSDLENWLEAEQSLKERNALR